MVRGGEWADHSWAGDQQLLARNHPTDASARAASFLQFTLPEDWSPDDLQLALLALPVPSLHARRAAHIEQPRNSERP